MRTVFGADEQSELEVDVLRWVRLARMDLHERFLGGSGPTDVLAFPMDDDVAPGGRQPDQGGRGPGSPTEAADPPTVIGDVVVCPQVARRQTDGRGSLDDEVALLVVHGVLHLLNYDHAEDEESEAMRKRERELLAQFRELEQEEGR
jgi:probable rRNA maturation factor